MSRNSGYETAQLWARNTVGDQTWQNQVSTLDEQTLRMLVAQIRIQQRTFLQRRQFVEMMLDLMPEHACNCNKRWTTGDIPHAEGCERLKACTCERQWLGGGLFVLDHSPDCELNRWLMLQPRAVEPEGEEDATKVCTTCGDEVDADDHECPDAGDHDPS